jgi:hypothetical protein
MTPQRSGGRSRFKVIGLALLLVPLGFLALFMMGELAGGDVGGLSHLLQALPLLLVAAAAWRWPVRAGAVLVVVGLGVLVIYAILASSRFEIGTIALVEAILAVPVVSGVLLMLAGRPEGGPGHSRSA